MDPAVKRTGAATREENGPAVGALSLASVSGDTTGWAHPSGRAHAPQAGVVRGNEEDRAVGAPTGPPRPVGGVRHVLSRAAGEGDGLQPPVGEEADRERRPGRRRAAASFGSGGRAAPRAGRRRARGSIVCPAAPLTVNASFRPSGDNARVGTSRNAIGWSLGSDTAKCVSGSTGGGAGRFQASAAAAPMPTTASSQAAASRQRGARTGVGRGAAGSGARLLEQEARVGDVVEPPGRVFTRQRRRRPGPRAAPPRAAPSTPSRP